MTTKQPLLLTAQLRGDWEQVQQRVATSRYELRRSVQLAVSAYAIVAFVLQPLQPVRAWLPALQLAALGLIFTLFTLKFLRTQLTALALSDGHYRMRRWRGIAERVAMCGGVLGLTALASLTMPHQLRPAVMRGLPFLSPHLAILLPVATIGFLALRVRPQNAATRLLGLAPAVSPRDILIGAGAGACLGLHFWITYAATLPDRPMLAVSFEHLVWVLSFAVGCQSLSEEIFFRGVLYRLYENETATRASNLAPILLLNTFVYLLPGLVTVLSDVWPWRVGYGLAFAGLATWLRDRQGNLTASIAANAAFSVLLTLRGVL